MGDEQLTEADKAALARMPDKKWFTSFELFPAVYRAEYRCERLTKVGMLESRVVGIHPRLERQWRKVTAIEEKH